MRYNTSMLKRAAFLSWSLKFMFKRASLCFIIFILTFSVSHLGIGLQVLAEAPSDQLPCSMAEACFRSIIHAEITEAEHPASLLERFHQVQEQFPKTIWARRAGIRVGLIHLRDDPAIALPFFQAGLRDFPILEDYLRLWMGKALLETGDARQAAREFQVVREMKTSSILTNVAMMENGHAWFQVGDCQRAVPLLTEVLQKDRSSPSVPKAWFEIVQCGVKEKNWTVAQEALQSLWVHHPEFFHADVENFLSSLPDGSFKWTPSSRDYFQRAKNFAQDAKFQNAVDDLHHVLESETNDLNLSTVRYTLAQTYVRLKQYKEAAELFRQAMQERTSFSGKATVWLARTYLRQNEGQALLALGMMRVSPWFSKHQKAEVLWMGGLWLEDQQQYEQALEAYQQAEALAKSSGVGLNALWQMGWLYYQLGSYREAIQSFQKIIDRSGNEMRQQQASFWTARALTYLGELEAAETLYRQMANDSPLTYYGQRARLQAKVPMLDRKVEDHVSENSLSFFDHKATFQRNVHYRRAMELHVLGLQEESTRELLQVKHSHFTNDQVVMELSLLLAKVGAYHEAIRMAIPLLRNGQNREHISKNSVLWPLVYPSGYLPIIRKYATAHIDPYLIAGLIREESLYDPRALSGVGAMGLMQLMPETADKMARHLGIATAIRKELFLPNLNIRLGTAYLGELLKQFEGKIIYSVAAYNAGPQAVNRWIRQFGDRDAEEFIELIPYRETRRYVKRVLTSYHVYKSLMPTSCSMISIDTVC